MTMVVKETEASLEGGRGITAAVRETLASGRVDNNDSNGGAGGGGQESGGVNDGSGGQRLLEYVDALVLAREETGGWVNGATAGGGRGAGAIWSVLFCFVCFSGQFEVVVTS